MTHRERYLRAAVQADLAKKMVFVGGPRQVGKTTLAVDLLGRAGAESPGYLNWDDLSQRAALLRGEIPKRQSLLVLDEIHKYPRWRSLVKGLYDRHHAKMRLLVTGSARLDFYRRGGDSLQGRYHYYRLHPFSLGELDARSKRSTLDLLLKFGGFPEPLFAANERDWRRWQREHRQRVVYDDLRDLERVREVGMIELLVETLPERVGAPLSLKSLSDLLQVSHEAIARWITILERLYVCFRITPYGSPRIRAVKKEQKLYFWDWSLVPNDGRRFENFVASQLLKYCHFVEDTEGHAMELRFVRDTDKREIDFVVLRDRKPLFAVECKTGERQIAPAARYFRERTPIPRFFQVHLGKKDFGDADTDVRVIPFEVFCSELELP